MAMDAFMGKDRQPGLLEHSHVANVREELKEGLWSGGEGTMSGISSTFQTKQLMQQLVEAGESKMQLVGEEQSPQFWRQLEKKMEFMPERKGSGHHQTLMGNPVDACRVTKSAHREERERKIGKEFAGRWQLERETDEEKIYWGCFYFFPWLRMWKRGKREQP